ncbi:MAG TPA: hypothetical protein VFE63_04955 [Roseiarcus sp.]|nr:hypothetical protein [Roseiarcus sp.]
MRGATNRPTRFAFLSVLSAAAPGAPVAAAKPLPATIVLHDGGFDFRDIGFRSGDVDLTIVNRGERPHALAIASGSSPAGTPIERTGALSPGQTTHLSLALPQDRYRIYSPLGHDRQHGLSASMIVMSPEGKGGAEMNRVFYNF